MANKEFKRKFMHPTRRKLVDMVLNGGEYDKNTTIGYTPVKDNTKRKAGDVWEDKDGNVWTQLESGVKVKKSKLTDTMSDVRKWLDTQGRCKNKECEKPKYGPTDKRLIKKTGFCTNCLADKEAQIKLDGLFVEYADYRVSQNQIYDYEELPVPWRRESTFELLWHPDNGFYENKWTYTETRKNQIRFYNQVLKGLTDWKKDGVDNTEYHLMNEIKKKKINYIYVEL